MIYLVDDDIDDLEVVQLALVHNSYKGSIQTAANGKVFLEQLNLNPLKPDVILLDLNMPLKDGFAVLKEIRSHPEFSTIPVIILTSSVNKHDEMRCFELGCNFFFRKPHSMVDYDPIALLVKGLSGHRTF